MRAIMASRQYRVEGKAEVIGPDGVYVDVTAFLGGNWLHHAEWTEHADQPVASGTITLIRDDSDLAVSLAPAIGASPANRDLSAAYVPFLKEGRACRILAAVTAAGVPAVAGDFVEAMRGRIDWVRQSSTENAVRLDFRDPGAVLLDYELEEEQLWADDPIGLPLEDIIQASLDAVHGVGTYALYVPASPGTIMRNITIAVGKHLERLRDVALLIGWELRYRYDDAGVMRLTLYEPNRTSTVRKALDSFTGTNGTLLTAHLGEQGAIWAQHPARAGNAQIAGNRLRNSTAAISHHTASVVPSLSPNYRVSVIVRRLSVTVGAAGVVGRMSTATTENGYLARYNDNIDAVELVRFDAGVETVLLSFPQALTLNTDHQLALVMAAERIAVEWDGAEYGYVGDATYPGVGAAGVWFSGVAGGDAAGLHLDTFTVYSADTVFAKSEYLAIPRQDIGLDDVRNIVRVDFTDITTGTRDTRSATDAASLAEYGARLMVLAFAKDSNINTGAEAQQLADVALFDLSTPYTDHDAETVPFYWPAQVGDVYEFEANGVTYDSNQLFGVVGFTHSLTADGGGTRFATKGKVVGSVKEWLRRGDVDASELPTLAVAQTAQTDTATTFRPIAERFATLTFTLANCVAAGYAGPGPHAIASGSDVVVSRPPKPSGQGSIKFRAELDAARAAEVSRTVPPLVAEVDSENLLLNGSGDDGAFGAAAPGWLFGAGAPLVPIDAPGYPGGRRLEIAATVAADNYSGQSIPVVAGQQFELSGYLEGIGVSAGYVALNVDAIGFAGFTVFAKIGPISLSATEPDVGVAAGVGGRQFVRVTFRVEGTGSIVVWAQLGYFNMVTGTARFDGLRLVRIVPADPNLRVWAVESTTSDTIYYESDADTLVYRTDSGADAAVPASGFTVSRNAAGGAKKVLTFTATRAGQKKSAWIEVLPQIAATATGTTAIVTSAYYVSTDYAADDLTIGWRYVGTLAGGQFEIMRIVTAGVTPDLTVAPTHLYYDSVSTSPATFVDTSIADDLQSGTGPKKTYSYQVRVLNSNGDVVGVSDWISRTETAV